MTSKRAATLFFRFSDVSRFEALTLLRPACHGAVTSHSPLGNCSPYFLLNCGNASLLEPFG